MYKADDQRSRFDALHLFLISKKTEVREKHTNKSFRITKNILSAVAAGLEYFQWLYKNKTSIKTWVSTSTQTFSLSPGV